MFHAAGHTIVIDTIRRIDTTAAADILDRSKKNDRIEKHHIHLVELFWLHAFDNIDVLEETIDGKNTFHCTQMMLQQRRPKNDEDYQKICCF